MMNETANEIAQSEKIQRLEQRHTQLIDELDALNNRLEQALNSFVNGNDDNACGVNDEARMTNEFQSPNVQKASSFGI